ncbi:iron chelate uptake ABC transporter family permease subunit [Pyrobaculum sp.]|uniref:iron chelate uptake ABC transporter family permease subunit n=1 Tax=Pyrobaculum sp. TaxID=2004705 RepID=UPI003D0EF6DB
MRSVLYISAALLLFFNLLWGPAGLDWGVIEAVRVPRVLGAVLAGAALSLAGLLLQTALRNPLADPYVLGVSGVSALTALLSYLAWRFFHMQYVGYLGGALAGAAAASLLLLTLSTRASLYAVLIAGVMTAFLTSAVLQLLLMLLPPEELGYVYLAMQGSFAAYPPGAVGYALALALVPVVAVAWRYSRWIAAYAHGEEAAAGLGVPVRRVNVLITALAAAATGLAVASVGPVGFIGLMAPHIARWSAGSHRFDKLVTPAVASGIALALLADAVTRALLPRDVPSSVVMSLVGVPFAVALFWRYVRGV